LLDGFALDMNESYDPRWIVDKLSGCPMLVVRSSWVRFVLFVCNKLTIVKLVTCIMSSMTVLKVSATQGILTTKIGSWADIRPGCP
jgi:hypothetical protein